MKGVLVVVCAFAKFAFYGLGSGFSCRISDLSLTNSLATSSLLRCDRMRSIVQPVSSIWMRFDRVNQHGQVPCGWVDSNKKHTHTHTNYGEWAKLNMRCVTLPARQCPSVASRLRQPDGRLVQSNSPWCRCAAQSSPIVPRCRFYCRSERETERRTHKYGDIFENMI